MEIVLLVLALCAKVGCSDSSSIHPLLVLLTHYVLINIGDITNVIFHTAFKFFFAKIFGRRTIFCLIYTVA